MNALPKKINKNILISDEDMFNIIMTKEFHDLYTDVLKRVVRSNHLQVLRSRYGLFRNATREVIKIEVLEELHDLFSGLKIIK